MIEVLLLTALILHGLVVWLRLREMRRRDVALFHLHRVQARLMRVVSDGVKSGALSRPDYNSARRLMDALDALAAECRKRRSWMFNLREFRRLLLDYGKAGGEITPLENPELRALCEEAARARALVFFAHTPFLRSRIALIVALRLGAAFSKNQAAAKFTRPLRDAERFGVKVGFFGETASA